jgi:DNA polymerase I-like protein with 3'-5' exonuclease and polymerase domains
VRIPERNLFFDFETTTIHKGHPFDPKNFAVSYAFLESMGECSFCYYADPDFNIALSNRLDESDAIIGFNIKFDLHWLFNIAGERDLGRIKVWDCQLAEFIYSGQEERYASLNEVCERYGLPTKIDLVKDYWDRGISTEHIPLPILREYNQWDVQLTKMLYEVQQSLLSEKQKRLVWLIGEDLKTLQAAEYAGVRFDFAKADEKLAIYQAALQDIDNRLAEFLPDSIPQGGFNYDSGDHLSALLYGGNISFDWCSETPAVYKSGEKKGQDYIRRNWFSTTVEFPQWFKPLEGTEVAKTSKLEGTGFTRFYQTDQPTLQQLKTRSREGKVLLSLLAERAGKIKVVEMINTVKNKYTDMNWQDSFIHGQFNQNVVITGRLSSSGPNLQNTPPEVDELFVSRYV